MLWIGTLLSMLIAIIGMNVFGVSANLMSLGAIDFGLIVLCALFLKDARAERQNHVVTFLQRRYEPLLTRAMRHRLITVTLAVVLCLISASLIPYLGSEFLPELDGGAIAINHARLKSVSLTEAVRQAVQIERTVKSVPEVSTTVSRIGRPEIATDPMRPDMADTYVFLKPRSSWRAGMTKAKLVQEMSEALEQFHGVAASFSQPIKFRMMELIEGVGVRSDIGIKIFGDDMDAMPEAANRVAANSQHAPMTEPPTAR